MVDHPGGVIIIPILQDPNGEDKYILVRQYRYPVRKPLWEFPAGKLDAEETPLECAKRELDEETGYGGGSWEKQLDLFTSPGYSNETLTIFVAKGIEPLNPENRAERPEGEFIVSDSFTLAQIVEMVRKEKIRDGKTLAGLFILNTNGD